MGALIYCVSNSDLLGFQVSRNDLCERMREIASVRTSIHELRGGLDDAPVDGFIVTDEPAEVAEQVLTEGQLRKMFLLDGPKGPLLYEFLERHESLGGFLASEWFRVRDVDAVRYPTLQRAVADNLSFERLERPASDRYAQYNPGLGLAELLVRYVEAIEATSREGGND